MDELKNKIIKLLYKKKEKVVLDLYLRDYDCSNYYFAIVYNCDDGRQQYIRFNKMQNSYTWEEQGDGYYHLQEKIQWIKDQELWESDLRPYYLLKKNLNTDPDLHSRTIFAIAVHEICQKNGYYD